MAQPKSNQNPSQNPSKSNQNPSKSQQKTSKGSQTPSKTQQNAATGHDTVFQKEVRKLQQEIQTIVERMQKDKNFTPDPANLEKISTRMVTLIQKHQPEIDLPNKHLLEAVVDLTEVPVMHPSTQREAYKVALREASQNIQMYLAA